MTDEATYTARRARDAAFSAAQAARKAADDTFAAARTAYDDAYYDTEVTLKAALATYAAATGQPSASPTGKDVNDD